MKRITALLLAVLLLSLPVISYTEQTVYQKEENTGRDKDSYPYIIRMPFATWYLAKADIELLGEDAFYKGLYAVLDDMEVISAGQQVHDINAEEQGWNTEWEW